MTTTNTTLTYLQFGLFFKNIVLRPDVTFASLNKALLNLFDGMPAILPIPPQAPSEIPVMTLRSESGGYTCNVARSRIDLIFQREGPDKSNEEIFKDFNTKVPAFAKHVLEEVDVVRFGLIARYFRAEENSPVSLKKKYFTDQIGKVSELGLRFNAVSDYQDWSINDVVEIGAGVQAVIGGVVRHGLHIQRDINNVAGERNFTITDLQRISAHYSQRVSEQSIQELLP